MEKIWGHFQVYWKPSAHRNIWMTKWLNIQFHYYTLYLNENLKQFGVEYHDPKHRREEKKYLNN